MSLTLRGMTLAIVVVVVVAGTPARADEPPQPQAIPQRDYDAPDPNRDVVTYLRAAANVTALNWLIWQFDWLVGRELFRVTGRDLVNNHIGGFPFDQDTITANFLGHPYAGALTFGAARGTGLGFWETTPYVVGGSLMWEFLSEIQKPATNDVIATSLGGIALGEIIFRLSSLALNDSRSGFARLTREVWAFGINPTRGANRLMTADAWTEGAPPVPKPARIHAHAGGDQITAGTVRDGANYRPSVLAAIDVEYGNLLPAPSRTTIPAYDFFDFYGAALLSSQSTAGFQFASLGLLHGWSTDVSRDEGPFRDNNVIGFVQSADYQGTNALDFSALGLGLGDFLVLRQGPRRRLRVGGDVQWAPLAAMVSRVNPYVGTDVVRDYNFSMGASIGLSVRWDIGRVGQLGLSAREYGTTVIEGIPGHELFGYARLWYEVDAYRDVLGVGLAQRLMHRMGSYTRDRSDFDTQLSLELYATIRL